MNKALTPENEGRILRRMKSIFFLKISEMMTHFLLFI